MERIEITRADFEKEFGVKPDPSSLGMCYYSVYGQPLCEFVFVDGEITAGETALEIAELERMFSL